MKAALPEATYSSSGTAARRLHALRSIVHVFPRRRFLFLQGIPGAFMRQLALALASRGHGVLRVNFNGGDRASWRSLPYVDFTGGVADWPAFLQRLVLNYAPTDVILFGDCRPLHKVAIELADRVGIAVHVFEEGYLRPDWVTLEIGGVNGYSRLPKTPAAYRVAADLLPEQPLSAHVPPRVRTRARDCLNYAVACLLMGHRFRRYATHRGWSLPHEGIGWVKRSLRATRARQRSEAAVDSAFAALGGFFLLPIQMDNDSQILCHSELGGMMHAIRLVIDSFARHAPAHSTLAIKEHPLDNGVIDWRAVIEGAARDAGVPERVVLIEAYDLQPLLDRALGMVTVNSTAATFALASGVPVIALGRAVYDLPGLTHQGSLEDFWTAPVMPDPALFDAFRRVLAHACLLPGDYFTRDGVARAVAAAVPRIEAARDAKARLNDIVDAAVERTALMA